LHHITDVRGTIESALDYLEEGGLLLIRDHDVTDRETEAYVEWEHDQFDKWEDYYFGLFSFSSLEQTLNDMGLKTFKSKISSIYGTREMWAYKGTCYKLPRTKLFHLMPSIYKLPFNLTMDDELPDGAMRTSMIEFDLYMINVSLK